MQGKSVFKSQPLLIPYILQHSMHRRQLIMILSLSLLLAPVMIQVVQSYEINPAKWIFYQKDDYELKPIYFDFQIKNTNNGTIKVSLKTMPPEYLYADQYPGNQAFPDYSWITVAETNITIPANQTVEVPVYVNIPTQYYPNGTSLTAVSNYNKTYEAWFIAHQTAGPGNIRIDYRCRWVFITPVKYVPPWQRKGALFPFPDEVLYSIILIIIAFLAVVVVLLRYRGRRPPKKKPKEQQPESTAPRSEGDVWEPDA
jgi:hypothetical protein